MLAYRYTLGSSLAGRAFQVRWGDSGIEKYPNRYIPWGSRTGAWIQPFSIEDELQSSYIFQQLYGPYNTFNPFNETNSSDLTYVMGNTSWVGQISYGLGGGNEFEVGGGVVQRFNSFSEVPYLQTGTEQTKKGVVFPFLQKYKLLYQLRF